MRKISAFAFAAMLTLGGLSACGDGQTEIGLTASGATTLQPLFAEAGEAWRQLRPEIYVESHGGGSSQGVLDVAGGRSDIAGVARELTASELAKVKAIPLALDGLAIVVSRDLAVQAVASDQLRRLYGGDVVPEGLPAQLTRVTKADGHGTLQAFLAGLQLQRSELRAEVTAGSNSEVLQVVAASDNAIGYVSNVDAQAALAAGQAIRIVPLDGILPSSDTVADGSYGLTRRLFVVTNFEPTEQAAAFLDFLQSEPGRQLIEQSGFLPL